MTTRKLDPESLTPKQRLFVSAYLVTMNATEAALRAGYSRGSSKVMGSRLLQDERVQIALKRQIEDRSRTTGVDAKFLLVHLAEMVKADIGDIYEEDGSFKPIHSWPRIWRQMLTGIDFEEIWAGSGDDRQQIGRATKAKFIDRLRAIELVGRHIDVKAFQTDGVTVNLNQQTTNVLAVVKAMSELPEEELGRIAIEAGHQLTKVAKG